MQKWSDQQKAKFKRLLKSYLLNSPSRNDVNGQHYLDDLWDFAGPLVSKWIDRDFFASDMWDSGFASVTENVFESDDERNKYIDGIADFVSTLPAKYTFDFCFGNTGDVRYELTKKVRIKPVDGLADLTNLFQAAFIPPPEGLNYLALSLDFYGYSMAFHDCELQKQAIDFAKRLLYMGKALGMFEYEYFPLDGLMTPVIWSDNFFGNVELLKVDADFATALGRYHLFKNSIDRLRKLAHAIESNKDPEFRSLLNAALWAFDAQETQDQRKILTFTSIAMECLLGSNELHGETSKGRDGPTGIRIADRIAYILGETQQEQTEISARVKEFYALRSKFVHGETARLLTNEDDAILADIIKYTDEIFDRNLRRFFDALPDRAPTPSEASATN